jgi:hypothetical protein
MARQPLAFEEEEDDKPVEPEVIETALGKRLTNRIANKVADDIQSQAIAVARSRGTADEVATSVLSSSLDTLGLKSDAAQVLTTAFSMGREQFIEEHADEVEYMQYSAILDRSVCSPCREMDGQEFELDSEAYAKAVPPNKDCDGGGQCRCIAIAVFKK